jgi:hypothetical protein
MEVNPDKQNIDTLFATKNYHIDFYQRDYRWTGERIPRCAAHGGANRAC